MNIRNVFRYTRSNKINVKGFRKNTHSGSTQNDGYNMTQELLVRLGIPIIIWSCLVCYIKIQGNKDEIKAIKEMVQNEIKVIKEMVKIDIESMEYLNKINKEMVKIDIKSMADLNKIDKEILFIRSSFINIERIQRSFANFKLQN
jgi:hypothetical protein